ncbi:MAG: phage terminase large subunit, partial [Bacteroidia bacterium]
MSSVNVVLNPKQKKALRILTNFNTGTTEGYITEVVFGGAASGGKTFLGCAYLISSALKYPESRWLMGRAKLSDLKDTTLKTFFQVCKQWGLKIGEHFKVNYLSHEIKFYNGSEIVFKDLAYYPSDPDYTSLGGLELCGAFLDELGDIPEKAKNTIAIRIRYKLKEFGITPKMLMTCNPTRNWVFSEYYQKYENGTLEPHKGYIQALPMDNPHTDPNYILQMERSDEISRQRYLFGNWHYASELSIFDFDKICDMFLTESYLLPEENKSSIVFTIDPARLGKDKTAILVWDDLNIIEIKELSKLRLDEQKIIIESMMKRYGITN